MTTFAGGGGDGGTYGDTSHADYMHQLKMQEEIDALIASYTHPATGFGGYGYSPTGKSPLPNHLGGGYQQAAGFIMRGSQGAQEEMRQSYESMLRSKSGAVGAGYGSTMQRSGAGLAGQGVSPQLAQLLLGGQRSNLLSSFGQTLGQDEAGYHSALAELMKGTGTELAGLKTKELGDTLNYLVGKASADAAGADPLAGFANLLQGAGAATKMFG